MTDKFLRSLEWLINLRHKDPDIPDEEFDEELPSDYALMNALEVLVAVRNYLESKSILVEHTNVTTIGDGNVRLSWENVTRTKIITLTLAHTPNKKGHVYFGESISNKSALYYEPSTQQVCELVGWCRDRIEGNWPSIVFSQEQTKRG